MESQINVPFYFFFNNLDTDVVVSEFFFLNEILMSLPNLLQRMSRHTTLNVLQFLCNLYFVQFVILTSNHLNGFSFFFFFFFFFFLQIEVHL